MRRDGNTSINRDHPNYKDYDYEDSDQHGIVENGSRRGGRFSANIATSLSKSPRTHNKHSTTLGKAAPVQSFIQRLPLENLAQVFARLPPVALQTCALVCRAWHDLVDNDTTWRAALLHHFNLEGRNLDEIPGKRLSRQSWRSEYAMRYVLAQGWARSRLPTVTHDPHIGNISLIHADIALRTLMQSRNKATAHNKQRSEFANNHGNAPSMLAVSIPRGIAARSDPFNGKVAKGGPIEGVPVPALLGAMLGNIDAVTCAAISSDGATIAWGMANGAVHISRTGIAGRNVPVQGQRTALPVSLGTPMDNHLGPITAMAFLPDSDYIATTATDSQAKLWNVGSAACIWTSTAAHSEGMTIDEGSCLAISRSRNDCIIIAVGTNLGAIKIWKIDTVKYTTQSAIKLDRNTITKQPTIGGQRTAVKYLALSANDSSVLLQYQGGCAFYRLQAIDRLSTTVTTFGHTLDHIACITAFAYDFGSGMPAVASTIDNGIKASLLNTSDDANSTTFGTLAYVIAGDDHGRMFLWNWNAKDSAKGESLVKPIRQLQGFEHRVTAIAITDMLHIVGTADGIVRAYDILSGRLVRLFNERSAPRQALLHMAHVEHDVDEAAKWAVSHIAATGEGFVASIGAKILAWSIGSETKHKKKTNRAGGRLSARADRYRADLEMRHDIRESSTSLAFEQEELARQQRQYRAAQHVAGIPRALGDMTEDEAVALAIMLSRQDEEERQVERSMDLSLDGDIDHLRLDEELSDEEEDSNDDTSTTSSRFSRSGPTSPYGQAGSSNYPYIRDGHISPSFRAGTLSPLSSSVRSNGNSRLQISPRLSPQYWPARQPPPQLDLNEASAWPLPSPIAVAQYSASAPRGASWTSRLPSPRLDHGSSSTTWSNIARSAGTTPPQWNVVATTAASSTSAFRHNSHVGHELDDDLRFAIELSLAEEQSRTANGQKL